MAAASTLKNMALCLTAVCLVCSAVVGVSYAVTADPIAAAARAKTTASIARVLPEFTAEPEQGSGRGTLRQMCADYSDYLQSHADFLRTLEDNDIIYLLYDGFYESLMSCDCFFTGMAEEIRTYAADFMAGGFMSIARAYLRSGSRTDAALLEELIVGLFNGQLFEKNF